VGYQENPGLILAWEAGEGLRTARLEPGKTYYIGRPNQEILDKHPYLDPTGIYIIPEKGGKPIDTGIRKVTVSRLHAKLTISPDGSTITIKDHGPYGWGASNPTYVGNQLLPKGSSKRVHLPPGEAITIQLTSQGPTFTLINPEHGQATLSLTAGTLATLPRTLAKKVAAKARAQTITGGLDQTITVQGEGSVQEAIIVGGQTIHLNINIHQPRTSEEREEAVRQILQKLLGALLELEIALLKQDRYGGVRGVELEASNMLHLLLSQPVREAIEGLGPEAQNSYTQLVHLLRYKPTDTVSIIKRIEGLRIIIKTKLGWQE